MNFERRLIPLAIAFATLVACAPEASKAKAVPEKKYAMDPHSYARP